MILLFGHINSLGEQMLDMISAIISSIFGAGDAVEELLEEE